MPSKSGATAVHRMRGESAPALPPPFEDMLPSGLTVKWRMPDPFRVVLFDGVVPDPLTAATIQLLKDEKSYTPDSDPRKFRYDAQDIMGMYGLAGAMLEEPKLDPSLEYGADGTLGRRQLGYRDVCHLYAMFCFFTQPGVIPTPNTEGAGRASDAAPDSDGVPPDASAADGD